MIVRIIYQSCFHFFFLNRINFCLYFIHIQDINEVIHNLHSIHWSDRKDGLQALQAYFRSGRMLSSIELKKVTDIFSKIFMDPHTKASVLCHLN